MLKLEEGNGSRGGQSLAEPQPKNDRIMAGQTDRKMNDGKRERDTALILQRVTKKTGKLNFAENYEFWNIALQRSRRTKGITSLCRAGTALAA